MEEVLITSHFSTFTAVSYYNFAALPINFYNSSRSIFFSCYNYSTLAKIVFILTFISFSFFFLTSLPFIRGELSE